MPAARWRFVRTEPRISTESVHVAAVLGLEADVRHLLDADPSSVRSRAGEPPAEPLLWLCYSPFHGENTERDEGLAASARALLDAGADPATRDAQYGIQALYAVTGNRNVPRIARMLLDAGANPTDGESVFHAAERFHEESLELLHGYGVDLNDAGEWGNTPLYFLLRHWDIERDGRVRQGLLWLLDHGADPNVRCGREQETSLHVAVRRGQSPRVVRLLLDCGANVHARRADDRTPWILAERGGFDELRVLLEQAGATADPLSPDDTLMAACGRGDEEAAQRLATPVVLAALEPVDLQLLVEAARKGRLDIVRACLAASFPVDTTDETGATALHGASIAGYPAIVRELLRRGADFRIHDAEHDANPLDWACFGADFVAEPGGDYESCVSELLEAGARLSPGRNLPQHAAVREVLSAYVAE